MILVDGTKSAFKLRPQMNILTYSMFLHCQICILLHIVFMDGTTVAFFISDNILAPSPLNIIIIVTLEG